MKTCMKKDCEEEALRGIMHCAAHQPGRGTKVKKGGRTAVGRKMAAKKAAKKSARKKA